MASKTKQRECDPKEVAKINDDEVARDQLPPNTMRSAWTLRLNKKEEFDFLTTRLISLEDLVKQQKMVEKINELHDTFSRINARIKLKNLANSHPETTASKLAKQLIDCKVDENFSILQLKSISGKKYADKAVSTAGLLMEEYKDEIANINQEAIAFKCDRDSLFFRCLLATLHFYVQELWTTRGSSFTALPHLFKGDYFHLYVAWNSTEAKDVLENIPVILYTRIPGLKADCIRAGLKFVHLYDIDRILGIDFKELFIRGEEIVADGHISIPESKRKIKGEFLNQDNANALKKFGAKMVGIHDALLSKQISALKGKQLTLLDFIQETILEETNNLQGKIEEEKKKEVSQDEADLLDQKEKDDKLKQSIDKHQKDIIASEDNPKAPGSTTTDKLINPFASKSNEQQREQPDKQSSEYDPFYDQLHLESEGSEQQSPSFKGRGSRERGKEDFNSKSLFSRFNEDSFLNYDNSDARDYKFSPNNSTARLVADHYAGPDNKMYLKRFAQPPKSSFGSLFPERVNNKFGRQATTSQPAGYTSFQQKPSGAYPPFANFNAGGSNNKGPGYYGNSEGDELNNANFNYQFAGDNNEQNTYGYFDDNYNRQQFDEQQQQQLRMPTNEQIENCNRELNVNILTRGHNWDTCTCTHCAIDFQNFFNFTKGQVEPWKLKDDLYVQAEVGRRLIERMHSKGADFSAVPDEEFSIKLKELDNSKPVIQGMKGAIKPKEMQDYIARTTPYKTNFSFGAGGSSRRDSPSNFKGFEQWDPATYGLANNSIGNHECTGLTPDDLKLLPDSFAFLSRLPPGINQKDHPYAFNAASYQATDEQLHKAFQDIKILILKNRGDLPTSHTMGRLLDLPGYLDAHTRLAACNSYQIRDNYTLELAELHLRDNLYQVRACTSQIIHLSNKIRNGEDPQTAIADQTNLETKTKQKQMLIDRAHKLREKYRNLIKLHIPIIEWANAYLELTYEIHEVKLTPDIAWTPEHTRKLSTAVQRQGLIREAAQYGALDSKEFADCYKIGYLKPGTIAKFKEYHLHRMTRALNGIYDVNPAVKAQQQNAGQNPNYLGHKYDPNYVHPNSKKGREMAKNHKSASSSRQRSEEAKRPDQKIAFGAHTQNQAPPNLSNQNTNYSNNAQVQVDKNGNTLQRTLRPSKNINYNDNYNSYPHYRSKSRGGAQDNRNVTFNDGNNTNNQQKKKPFKKKNNYREDQDPSYHNSSHSSYYSSSLLNDEFDAKLKDNRFLRYVDEILPNDDEQNQDYSNKAKSVAPKNRDRLDSSQSQDRENNSRYENSKQNNSSVANNNKNQNKFNNNYRSLSDHLNLDAYNNSLGDFDNEAHNIDYNSYDYYRYTCDPNENKINNNDLNNLNNLNNNLNNNNINYNDNSSSSNYIDRSFENPNNEGHHQNNGLNATDRSSNASPPSEAASVAESGTNISNSNSGRGSDICVPIVNDETQFRKIINDLCDEVTREFPDQIYYELKDHIDALKNIQKVTINPKKWCSVLKLSEDKARTILNGISKEGFDGVFHNYKPLQRDRLLYNMCSKRNFHRSSTFDAEVQQAAGDLTIEIYNAAGFITEVQEKDVKALGAITFRSKNDGTLRLIYDARQVNVDFPSPEFTLTSPMAILSDKFTHFIKIDLANAFFHFKLNKEFSNRFCFQWNGQYFKWNVLPFGFSRGSYYCQKLFEPLWAYIREKIDKRCKLVAYMDDVCIAGPSKEIVETAGAIFKSICDDLGVNINYNKSDFEPKEQIDYLGRRISQSQICNTDHTIQKIEIALQNYKEHNTIRNLLRLLGMISYATQIYVGARPLIQAFYNALPETCFGDIEQHNDLFGIGPDLQDNLDSLMFLIRSNVPWTFMRYDRTYQIYTDASEIALGFAGFSTLEKCQKKGAIAYFDIPHYMWDHREGCANLRKYPIHVLELYAIYIAVLNSPCRCNLVIYTDSNVAIGLVKKGITYNTSPIAPCIQTLIDSIHAKLATNQISLVFRRVESENNPADHPSREPDKFPHFKELNRYYDDKKKIRYNLTFAYYEGEEPIHDEELVNMTIPYQEDDKTLERITDKLSNREKGYLALIQNYKTILENQYFFTDCCAGRALAKAILQAVVSAKKLPMSLRPIITILVAKGFLPSQLHFSLFDVRDIHMIAKFVDRMIENNFFFLNKRDNYNRAPVYCYSFVNMQYTTFNHGQELNEQRECYPVSLEEKEAILNYGWQSKFQKQRPRLSETQPSRGSRGFDPDQQQNNNSNNNRADQHRNQIIEISSGEPVNEIITISDDNNSGDYRDYYSVRDSYSQRDSRETRDYTSEETKSDPSQQESPRRNTDENDKNSHGDSDNSSNNDDNDDDNDPNNGRNHNNRRNHDRDNHDDQPPRDPSSRGGNDHNSHGGNGGGSSGNGNGCNNCNNPNSERNPTGHNIYNNFYNCANKPTEGQAPELPLNINNNLPLATMTHDIALQAQQMGIANQRRMNVLVEEITTANDLAVVAAKRLSEVEQQVKNMIPAVFHSNEKGEILNTGSLEGIRSDMQQLQGELDQKIQKLEEKIAILDQIKCDVTESSASNRNSNEESKVHNNKDKKRNKGRDSEIRFIDISKDDDELSDNDREHFIFKNQITKLKEEAKATIDKLLLVQQTASNAFKFIDKLGDRLDHHDKVLAELQAQVLSQNDINANLLNKLDRMEQRLEQQAMAQYIKDRDNDSEEEEVKKPAKKTGKPCKKPGNKFAKKSSSSDDDNDNAPKFNQMEKKIQQLEKTLKDIRKQACDNEHAVKAVKHQNEQISANVKTSLENLVKAHKKQKQDMDKQKQEFDNAIGGFNGFGVRLIQDMEQVKKANDEKIDATKRDLAVTIQQLVSKDLAFSLDISQIKRDILIHTKDIKDVNKLINTISAACKKNHKPNGNGSPSSPDGPNALSKSDNKNKRDKKPNKEEIKNSSPAEEETKQNSNAFRRLDFSQGTEEVKLPSDVANQQDKKFKDIDDEFSRIMRRSADSNKRIENLEEKINSQIEQNQDLRAIVQSLRTENERIEKMHQQEIQTNNALIQKYTKSEQAIEANKARILKLEEAKIDAQNKLVEINNSINTFKQQTAEKQERQDKALEEASHKFEGYYNELNEQDAASPPPSDEDDNNDNHDRDILKQEIKQELEQQLKQQVIEEVKAQQQNIDNHHNNDQQRAFTEDQINIIRDIAIIEVGAKVTELDKQMTREIRQLTTKNSKLNNDIQTLETNFNNQLLNTSQSVEDNLVRDFKEQIDDIKTAVDNKFFKLDEEIKDLNTTLDKTHKDVNEINKQLKNNLEDLTRKQNAKAETTERALEVFKQTTNEKIEQIREEIKQSSEEVASTILARRAPDSSRQLIQVQGELTNIKLDYAQLREFYNDLYKRTQALATHNTILLPLPRRGIMDNILLGAVTTKQYYTATTQQRAEILEAAYAEYVTSTIQDNDYLMITAARHSDGLRDKIYRAFLKVIGKFLMGARLDLKELYIASRIIQSHNTVNLQWRDQANEATGSVDELGLRVNVMIAMLFLSWDEAYDVLLSCMVKKTSYAFICLMAREILEIKSVSDLIGGILEMFNKALDLATQNDDLNSDEFTYISIEPSKAELLIGNTMITASEHPQLTSQTELDIAALRMSEAFMIANVNSNQGVTHDEFAAYVELLKDRFNRPMYDVALLVYERAYTEWQKHPEKVLKVTHSEANPTVKLFINKDFACRTAIKVEMVKTNTNATPIYGTLIGKYASISSILTQFEDWENFYNVMQPEWPCAKDFEDPNFKMIDDEKQDEEIKINNDFPSNENQLLPTSRFSCEQKAKELGLDAYSNHEQYQELINDFKDKVSLSRSNLYNAS